MASPDWRGSRPSAVAGDIAATLTSAMAAAAEPIEGAGCEVGGGRCAENRQGAAFRSPRPKPWAATPVTRLLQHRGRCPQRGDVGRADGPRSYNGPTSPPRQRGRACSWFQRDHGERPALLRWRGYVGDDSTKLRTKYCSNPHQKARPFPGTPPAPASAIRDIAQVVGRGRRRGDPPWGRPPGRAKLRRQVSGHRAETISAKGRRARDVAARGGRLSGAMKKRAGKAGAAARAMASRSSAVPARHDVTRRWRERRPAGRDGPADSQSTINASRTSSNADGAGGANEQRPAGPAANRPLKQSEVADAEHQRQLPGPTAGGRSQSSSPGQRAAARSAPSPPIGQARDRQSASHHEQRGHRTAKRRPFTATRSPQIAGKMARRGAHREWRARARQHVSPGGPEIPFWRPDGLDCDKPAYAPYAGQTTGVVAMGEKGTDKAEGDDRANACSNLARAEDDRPKELLEGGAQSAPRDAQQKRRSFGRAFRSIITVADSDADKAAIPCRISRCRSAPVDDV